MELRPEDIRAYVARDWDAAEQNKADSMARLRAERGIGALSHLLDGMRASARHFCPDWPTGEDRAEDLAHHQRMSALFARAARKITTR